MHPMNQPRHIIRKSAAIVKDAGDRQLLKSVIDIVGHAGLCGDGSITAGELQRLLSDGSSRISETSRVVNQNGHYGGGFGDIERRSELARALLKMHRTDSEDGNSEPPWYSLARTMLRKGYNVDQVRRTLKKTEQEMDRFLVPAGV